MENRDLQGSWGGATVRQDYAMMMMMMSSPGLRKVSMKVSMKISRLLDTTRENSARESLDFSL